MLYQFKITIKPFGQRYSRCCGLASLLFLLVKVLSLYVVGFEDFQLFLSRSQLAPKREPSPFPLPVNKDAIVEGCLLPVDSLILPLVEVFKR
ncbi:MAG: hypothetical protein O6918_02495, partial [Deltaproteobacteria bacterium]|nr:hypothetical protein [Deltaproteobacteria bacterium]